MREFDHWVLFRRKDKDHNLSFRARIKGVGRERQAKGGKKSQPAIGLVQPCCVTACIDFDNTTLFFP